jgi:hypothetical protein
MMVKLIVKVPKADNEELVSAARKLDEYYKEDVRKNLKL